MGQFDSLFTKLKKCNLSVPVNQKVVEELKEIGEKLKVTQADLREKIFVVGLRTLKQELNGSPPSPSSSKKA